MGEVRKVGSMPAEITIGDGLSLRYIEPSDAEELLPIIQSDSEIRRSVTWPVRSHDLDSTRQCIDQLLQDPKDPYVVQKDDRAVGFAGTWDSEDIDRAIGLSYFLAKDERGNGYIKRAVNGLMQVVKQNREVDLFLANIEDGNDPSLAVVQSLGFEATNVLTWENVLKVYIRRWEKPANE